MDAMALLMAMAMLRHKTMMMAMALLRQRSFHSAMLIWVPLAMATLRHGFPALGLLAC